MKIHIGIIGIGIIVLMASLVNTVTAADNSTNRPFLAIWKDDDGLTKSEAPFLRVAIWNDGRVLFAKDASKWNHQLLEGRIDVALLNDLKKAIEKTGVFELKGNCYLVPDAPVDCVMLNFSGKQQMLYWDEVESQNYGINIDPTENHLKFKSSWKEVNRLALGAIPKNSQPHAEKFQSPPQSWRLKKPIQSE